MARVSRNVAVYVCVVLCCLLAAGIGISGSAKAKAQEQSASPGAKEKVMKVIAKAQAEAKPVDPYKDARIMVEAYVVKVDLQELYKLGVCPLGSKPNAVSADHILNCLREGKGAEIITGTKMAVRQNHQGTVEQDITSIQTANNRVVSRSNAPQKEFSARTIVIPSGEISVDYSFSMINVIDSENESISEKVTNKWSSSACLEAGKPQIVGEVQEGVTAMFLILTADYDN